MGGYFSGRSGGRPTAESCLKVELGRMIRDKRAVPGSYVSGTLSWNCRGENAGSVTYVADMLDPEASELRLSYIRPKGSEREKVNQTIRLVYTQPHYGGRRWWMICPFGHNRVDKLYFPPGGDRFAGRKAWRLGYHIQRVAARDRPFEALFRLQAKLGCEQGWGGFIRKPKGMWWRTYERHWQRYLELDEICAVEMQAMVRRIGGLCKSKAK